MVGKLLPPQTLKLTPEVFHVLIRHEKRLLRFMDFPPDVPCVDHRETPLRRGKGQVQSVVAADASGGRKIIRKTSL